MLRVALISDELTSQSIKAMDSVKVIENQFAYNFWRRQKPDLLLVESCWRGFKDQWRYVIPSYIGYPERTNIKLIELLELADKHNIPAVFWNKEDGVHFNRFIDSASLFKYILTVDSNCIKYYKDILDNNVKVGVLPFAVQPKFHHPTILPPTHNRSLFIGSYSHHIHDERREWQNMMFSEASKFGLTIIDRNSNRKSDLYRYPVLPNTKIHPLISHSKTGKWYRRFTHCINVNTVTDSPSMFSRRLIEIMACKRLVITNPSLSVDTRFNGMCEIVSTKEQANELLSQLSKGYTKSQTKMMQIASHHVLANYNYDKWMQEVLNFIEL